jgi:hypothetical protein
MSDIGINFKYINSRIADESANGLALDAGWRYKMPVKGLNIGFAVQNLGPKMKFIDERSSLPLSARFGAGYKIVDNILLAFDVNRRINEKKTVFCFGSEYSVFNSFFIRAGYINSGVSGAISLADYSGFKAGFGIKLRNLNLDYAITPFSGIGKAHTLSLGAGF